MRFGISTNRFLRRSIPSCGSNSEFGTRRARSFAIWWSESIRVLRSELGVADGLADPAVWILDPCCGTGAYLVEVLDRIARTLHAKGEDALTAEDLKQAAMTRVAGFEIMPAPYVISHWQIGHALRRAGAPLDEDERAAVFLTNALTGWAAPLEAEAPNATQRGIRYTYPPLADERDEATRVKRARPILVVLGNPPYNAFAGTSPAEEVRLGRSPRKGCDATGASANSIWMTFTCDFFGSPNDGSLTVPAAASSVSSATIRGCGIHLMW